RDYGQGEQRDPLGAQTGVSRVLRGGSWYYFARHCRSAFRYYYSPDYRFNYLGFRLCRSIP
ncbi:MAG TPA: SUMF1/EgtB/PvdO family nonheme iron enzyme, partial [Polyangiaceae bacterium]|nr:SUMF1/EgtB/PvdO family nonheme iron enzyme [Polyangiaceae bacterium]HOR38316.1 SUMF1/EgtB/PvdO family nonheme iron enzyme [Polyangiaceae bacterium]HPB99212.1 SUMF1/EgtB/PvdO family nonheme iron enzyme [Polyangiaceae bacterium]